jgi:isoleucyl-tRNA synthetase
VAKQLGSSLQAEIDIQASGQLHDALARLGEDLRFVLITSRATVRRAEGSAPAVQVAPSAHAKCDRCWHYRADVNHEALCGRCQSNLKGPGEPRRFA